MNYGALKFCDIANGPGVRISLFVSGCEHYCKGCFNSEAWDFSFGEIYTDKISEEILKELGKNYVKGISILGGEPFHPKNQLEVFNLIQKIRSRYSCEEKDIWVYSGYLFEDLYSGNVGEYSRDIIENIDILVDGQFKIDLKDIGLNFRGSSNQRIIDIKKSLESNKIVLHPLGIGDSNKYNKEITNESM